MDDIYESVPCDVEPPAGFRRSNHDLRRLIVLGSLMAERLRELGPDPADAGATPMWEAWERLVERVRRPRETPASTCRREQPLDYATGQVPGERIQACERCGRVDHHCIDGLCPHCRTSVVVRFVPADRGAS